MRRFTDKPSPLYKKAVSILQEVQKIEGSAARVCAEVIHDQILQAFIKRNGLKPSNGARCVSRLLGKQCKYSLHPCTPPAVDHISLWNKDGKPHVYVSQPYAISWKNLQQIVDYCREHGLQAQISAESWHFPGQTVLLEYRADK